MKEKKTLGIVGGMGPLATAEFFYEITRLTKAEKDSEHIHIIIDSDASIPDRTQAIKNGGEMCEKAIIASVKRLKGAGAEVLAMPCNTAHAFFDSIKQAADGLTFLNMVEETVKETAKTPYKKVGLLAADGTVISGVYEREYEKRGIQTLLPSKSGQEEVMRVIYEGVKAGKTAFDTSGLRRELDSMAACGAGVFILACTELPIAFKLYGLDFRYIDTARALARAAVKACGCETAE